MEAVGDTDLERDDKNWCSCDSRISLTMNKECLPCKEQIRCKNTMVDIIHCITNHDNFILVVFFFVRGDMWLLPEDQFV